MVSYEHQNTKQTGEQKVTYGIIFIFLAAFFIVIPYITGQLQLLYILTALAFLIAGGRQLKQGIYFLNS